jgi:hypothetical protein
MALPFVGRERELKQIQQAMEKGENLILIGKYGIGRTRLVRHLVHRQEFKRWRFVFTDFSQTPLRLGQQMMVGLGLEGPGSIPRAHLSYPALRFRITHGNLPPGPRPVLVLDNIAKLTVLKLNLLRDLVLTGQFRFIAIVEECIPPKDLFRLRAWLRPALLLHISYLPRSRTQEFFRTAAQQRSLRWTESEIAHWAEIAGGYPLRMKEILIGKLMAHSPGQSKPFSAKGIFEEKRSGG